jgi:hypothetical protein
MAEVCLTAMGAFVRLTCKVGGYAKSLVNLYKKNFKSVTPVHLQSLEAV